MTEIKCSYCKEVGKPYLYTDRPNYICESCYLNPGERHKFSEEQLAILQEIAKDNLSNSSEDNVSAIRLIHEATNDRD